MHEERRRALAICAVATLASVGMLLLNKALLMRIPHLNGGGLLVLVQNLATILLVHPFVVFRVEAEEEEEEEQHHHHRHRHRHTAAHTANMNHLARAFLFGTNTLTSMLSLQSLSVTAFTIVRNAQPIITCPLGHCLLYAHHRRRPPCDQTPVSVFLLFAVLLGTVAYCRGQSSPHHHHHKEDASAAAHPSGYAGWAWAGAHLLSTALYTILTKIQLEEKEGKEEDEGRRRRILAAPLIISTTATAHPPPPPPATATKADDKEEEEDDDGRASAASSSSSSSSSVLLLLSSSPSQATQAETTTEATEEREEKKERRQKRQIETALRFVWYNNVLSLPLVLAAALLQLSASSTQPQSALPPHGGGGGGGHAAGDHFYYTDNAPGEPQWQWGWEWAGSVLLILASCVGSCLLSVVGVLLQTQMSPVSTLLFNNLNKIPALLIAACIWPQFETSDRTQPYAGIGLSLLGGCLYAHARHHGNTVPLPALFITIVACLVVIPLMVLGEFPVKEGVPSSSFSNITTSGHPDLNHSRSSGAIG